MRTSVPARPRSYQPRFVGRIRSFYEIPDVNVAISAGAILGFLTLCLVLVWWIFKTGWKLKA